MSTAAIFLLALSISFLRSSSWAAGAAAEEENLMQHLSRAELVRLAGYGEERLSSVLVTGSLLNQARRFTAAGSNHLITSHAKGAKVAVACRTDKGRTRRSNVAYGRTDEMGDFIIDVPSSMHAIPDFQDSCFVRILGTQKKSPQYHRISISNRIRIRLSYAGNDGRVYTTGTVRTSL